MFMADVLIAGKALYDNDIIIISILRMDKIDKNKPLQKPDACYLPAPRNRK